MGGAPPGTAPSVSPKSWQIEQGGQGGERGKPRRFLWWHQRSFLCPGALTPGHLGIVTRAQSLQEVLWEAAAVPVAGRNWVREHTALSLCPHGSTSPVCCSQPGLCAALGRGILVWQQQDSYSRALGRGQQQQDSYSRALRVPLLQQLPGAAFLVTPTCGNQVQEVLAEPGNPFSVLWSDAEGCRRTLS